VSELRAAVDVWRAGAVRNLFCCVPAWTGESFEEICKRADQALYAAKNQGRNCVVAAD